MVRCFAQTIHFHWAFLFTCPREVGWSCKHPWIPVLRGSVLEMEMELEEMRRWMMQVWCNKSLVPLLILSSSHHILQLFNRGAAIHFIGLPMHLICSPIGGHDGCLGWFSGVCSPCVLQRSMEKKIQQNTTDMGVSENSGTRNWMVYNGKPYWNGWFGGTTIFGTPHIVTTCWETKKWLAFDFVWPRVFLWGCGLAY